MNLKIRPFRDEDLKSIEDILKIIGWEDQYVLGQLEAIKRLCSSDSGEVYLATQDDSIIGFIQAEHQKWNRLSLIHGLVVHPDFRKRGIAKKLVESIEVSARSKDQRGIYVDTPADNVEGIKFYTSTGFHEAYIMPEFYEAGLDGVTFMKFFETPKTDTLVTDVTDVTENPDKILKSSQGDVSWVNKKLTTFNNQCAPFTQNPQDIFFNYHIKDSNGLTIAGINSIMYGWGVLFICALFVEEGYRIKSFGAQLLEHVENEAKKMGGYLVLLDTFDFQAKDFYVKAGYEVFGIVHGCPPRHTRYHMLKRL